MKSNGQHTCIRSSNSDDVDRTFKFKRLPAMRNILLLLLLLLLLFFFFGGGELTNGWNSTACNSETQTDAWGGGGGSLSFNVAGLSNRMDNGRRQNRVSPGSAGHLVPSFCCPWLDGVEPYMSVDPIPPGFSQPPTHPLWRRLHIRVCIFVLGTAIPGGREDK